MKYEELLEEAFKKIPERIEKRERFEVPEPLIETSKKRTVLRNFSSMAQALRRDERHFSTYLFKELATMGNIQAGSLVFQGRISSELIRKKISDYIKEFVICKECGNPDTKLVKEERLYFIKCDACGCKYPARKI